MFLYLPEDIQLAICAFLSPEEILSLKQTCRGLHAFGNMDYVWHSIRIDLPLNLPLNKDIKNMRSFQLQPIVMKALRLKRNWNGSPGCPWQLSRIRHDGIIGQMQMLRSRWLVTLSRSPLCTRLSVWCLNSGTYCCLISETHGALKFFAALQSESEATIAAIEYDESRRELLNIYSLLLPHGEDGKCVSRLCQSVSRPKGYGMFFDVHICEKIVAATVARFSDMLSPPSYEILLIDTMTHQQCIFDPKLPQSFERLRVKLFPDRIVLVGVKQNRVLTFLVYALQLPMISGALEGNRYPPPIDEVLGKIYGHLISEHESQFPSSFDFHLPLDLAVKSVSLIVFPVIRNTKETGYTFTFPLGAWAKFKTVGRPFHMQQKISVETACMGATGRRAVWLQRHWDTDEFELMKAGFSTIGAKVDTLLPKHTALPFEASKCHSLAFDEATGRVCVGLHTGELHVLDFGEV